MAHPSEPDAASFLESAPYGDLQAHRWELDHYLPSFWHPLAALSALPPGTSLCRSWLGRSVLLSRPSEGEVLAFANVCPHRGAALSAPSTAAQACRRWICPYHGWTYSTRGRLLAAAREREFLEPFVRGDWDLPPLECRLQAGLIWIRPGSPKAGPSLEEQLDLVRSEVGEALDGRRLQVGHSRRRLRCNWKLAHDNTLDDYHVATAHARTLHRLQGPVAAYRHRIGTYCNLLATPLPGGSSERGGEFLTFGVPPCHHLLFWPDRRLAVLSCLPRSPESCWMELLLLAAPDQAAGTEGWMAEMQAFLNEDRRLVESAQKGYASGFTPGPAHRLERRIHHHQQIYRAFRRGAQGPPSSPAPRSESPGRPPP